MENGLDGSDCREKLNKKIATKQKQDESKVAESEKIKDVSSYYP
uniref:Uncharacterized protein n=1 Tax=Tetranychus urticae TaxID=32264 RepID=T1KTG3_TETUR